MRYNTTIVGQLGEAAEIFATATRLVEAGHLVNVTTMGYELVLITSATQEDIKYLRS